MTDPAYLLPDFIPSAPGLFVVHPHIHEPVAIIGWVRAGTGYLPVTQFGVEYEPDIYPDWNAALARIESPFHR